MPKTPTSKPPRKQRTATARNAAADKAARVKGGKGKGKGRSNPGFITKKEADAVRAAKARNKNKRSTAAKLKTDGDTAASKTSASRRPTDSLRKPATSRTRPGSSARSEATSEQRDRPLVTRPSPTIKTRARPAPTAPHKGRRPRPRTSGPNGPSEPMRIARAIARAGLCSRREAERLIEEGRVTVNGRRLKTPAVEVGPDDRIKVDGTPLPAAEPVRLWRYHKPKGLVTTNWEPEGRPTVFDNLPEDMPRVVSIGRLDFNTEGLLLLTNDGALSRHLELPSTGWLRRYRVRAWGDITQPELDKLKDGITVDGVRYGPMEATLDSIQASNVWLTIGLREGKNREVRNVMTELGLEVNRLIRISYGPFQLTELKPGKAEIVRRKTLASQLGPKLAEEFNLTGPEDEEAETQPVRRPQKPSRPRAKK